MEPGDATHTTENMNHPVVELYGVGGTVAELIRLQTVIDEVVARFAVFRVQAA